MLQKTGVLFNTVIVTVLALNTYSTLPMLLQDLISGDQIGFEFVIVENETSGIESFLS